MSFYKHFLTVAMVASLAVTTNAYAEQEFSISITGPDGETAAPARPRPARPAATAQATPAPQPAVTTPAPAPTPTNTQGQQDATSPLRAIGNMLNANNQGTTPAQGDNQATPAQGNTQATTPNAGAVAGNQGNAGTPNRANLATPAQGNTPAATPNAPMQIASPNGDQIPVSIAAQHVVGPRETIWSISHRYSAPYNDVNEFQAVASIYRNNRNAFNDGNVNDLRRGATLNIPAHQEMAFTHETRIRTIPRLRGTH